MSVLLQNVRLISSYPIYTWWDYSDGRKNMPLDNCALFRALFLEVLEQQNGFERCRTAATTICGHTDPCWGVN